jgi:hypothetical protein
MDHVVTLAFLATGFYSVFKFIELRFFPPYGKDDAKLKYFVRDTCFVFGATILAAFLHFHLQPTLMEFMHVVTETKALHPATTEIFTGDPGF